jgi:hypothetical protein
VGGLAHEGIGNEGKEIFLVTHDSHRGKGKFLSHLVS